jgi:hypothetical protein
MAKKVVRPKTAKRRPRLEAQARRNEATAYHEAGHAVVSLALRRAVRRVSIIADDDTLGRCSSNPIGDWFRPDFNISGRERNIIETETIILLAGFHAEARFAGRRNHVGAASDMHKAVELLTWLAEGEALEKYLAWLNVRSKNLVNTPQNWRAIEYVARELLAPRKISGRAVRQLYRQAQRDLYREETGREFPEFTIDTSGCIITKKAKADQGVPPK